MKWCVYSVKDEKVAYNPPFYIEMNARADGKAIEAVKKAYENKYFGITAIDCTLYKIGTFNDVSGEHENYRFPEILLRVKDLMKGEDNDEISETL